MIYYYYYWDYYLKLHRHRYRCLGYWLNKINQVHYRILRRKSERDEKEVVVGEFLGIHTSLR